MHDDEKRLPGNENAGHGWKWTEKHPEYADFCRSIAERYNRDYEDFDLVRSAIEETVLQDPAEGSDPLFPEAHPQHDPTLRYFIFEEAPGWWELPSLVIVFQIEPAPSEGPHEVTGLEVWVEDELRALGLYAAV